MGKLNDFYSSADTLGDCFLLCEHQNCRGKCSRVAGKVTHLSWIGVNDKISSIRLCTEFDSPARTPGTFPIPLLAGRLFKRRRTKRNVDILTASNLPSSFFPGRSRNRRFNFQDERRQEKVTHQGKEPVINTQPLMGRAIRRRTRISQPSAENASNNNRIRHSINQELVRIPRHRRRRKRLRSEKS